MSQYFSPLQANSNPLESLTVLDLLAVAGGLLEGLDNERGGAGNDGDGGVTVLNGEADRDPQTLHVLGGLGDIITDLLGGLQFARWEWR